MPFPFLIPLIGAALGAGTGALVNKDNRGKGALIGGLTGGLAGFGAGKLPALAKLGAGAAKAAGGVGQAAGMAGQAVQSLPPIEGMTGGFFPQDPLQQSLPELMKAPAGTQAVKHWGNHNPSNLGTPAINRDMSTLRKLLPILPRRQQQQQQQLQPINVSMMDSQINPMGYPRQGGFFRG